MIAHIQLVVFSTTQVCQTILYWISLGSILVKPKKQFLYPMVLKHIYDITLHKSTLEYSIQSLVTEVTSLNVLVEEGQIHLCASIFFMKLPECSKYTCFLGVYIGCLDVQIKKIAFSLWIASQSNSPRKSVFQRLCDVLFVSNTPIGRKLSNVVFADNTRKIGHKPMDIKM